MLRSPYILAFFGEERFITWFDLTIRIHDAGHGSAIGIDKAGVLVGWVVRALRMEHMAQEGVITYKPGVPRSVIVEKAV